MMKHSSFSILDKLFFLSVEFIDDQCDCTVDCYVTSRTETIHGNVKRNHQSLFTFSKTEHGLKNTQACHNSTTWYTWSCYHGDT